MTLHRVHLVVGTRPEAIKLAPLAKALSVDGRFEPVLVATGQHPTMVSEALSAFGLRSDRSLRLARDAGSQAELVAELTPQLDAVLAERSSAVVVQGDTTSALVGGLIAHWRKLPLVHLEAGLRSGDLQAPFPEEANRRLLAVLADLHLAPTVRARDVLLAEGVGARQVVLVGNTVVDSALMMAAAPQAMPADDAIEAVLRDVATSGDRLVLVTAHRRESWGRPLDRILSAVGDVVDEHPDVRCVLPAHANPEVRSQVDRALSAHPRVLVTPPLAYPTLCRLLATAALVLSDSGGIQEEAPTFRVPVLVLRDVTERREAVAAGWAQLVGSDPGRIVTAAKEILDGTYVLPATPNPFGDGRAAERSASAIAWMLGLGARPRSFIPPEPALSPERIGPALKSDEDADVTPHWLGSE